MNILHLLSQNHLTGAEVYAATLAQNQINENHLVYQISNGFFFDTMATKTQLDVETKSFVKKIKNILWLRNYIKTNSIQVVHTHSRAAVKLAYWATVFSKTAMVSTVHGVQHASTSKKIHNQYGQFIIAVCENVKKHLISDYSYSKRNIKVIANPIDNKKFYVTQKTNKLEKKIAIVGRTTGPKALRTEQVINVLFSENIKNTSVFLIGGTLGDLNLPLPISQQITEINHVGLTSEHYASYDVVIGSGRVCMESIITGVPTIAFGEASYEGLITENNLAEMFKSNFGDIHLKSKIPIINKPLFLNDLHTALKTPTQFKLSEKATDLFLSVNVTKKILRIYESACFLKNYNKWIPVLMYHKIPNAEINSEHKIFVTKNNFEKHLSFFKSQGFETLTFSDIKKFRTGETNFSLFPKKPLILTFDDGYTDNLENASPLLKKYNFKAQIFLLADADISSNVWDTSGSEPQHDIVSKNNRKLWKASALEVGSHGFSHKKITELNNDEALTELSQSKINIETELNTEVAVYAFTYGITDERSEDLAALANYDYAVNTDTGGFLIEEEPYSIFRVNIFPDESLFSLYKKTSTWYRKYYYFKRKK